MSARDHAGTASHVGAIDAGGAMRKSDLALIQLPPRDRLWTCNQIAARLGVCARTIRDSGCPKILLPPTKGHKRSMVRYDPVVVERWWALRAGKSAGTDPVTAEPGVA